jgi:phosphoribosylamine--glycine ligase
VVRKNNRVAISGNTGGMGAYSPAPVVTEVLFKEILDTIIYRTLNGLLKEGIVYKGVLYAGIMLTEKGPRVLEFNVRFGDPEIQAILPRLNADIVELMLATVDGTPSHFRTLAWDERACICVVCASGGYPGSYEKGKEISGLDKLKGMQDIFVFHAGTKRIAQSAECRAQFVTNGGRVLNVVALGRDIKEAQAKVYAAIKNIHFEQMHYRKDIGNKALKFLN